jgi:magnesium-transporting ATPase (P-type)
MIRFILFPKPHNFNFLRESLIFILLLFVLCIIGFFVLLNNFLDILEPVSIFLKFLDLITISVPPLLVTALQVGIEYSLE